MEYYQETIKMVESTAIMLATYTKQNPVVGGLVTLWIMGGITFFTRTIPSKVLAIMEKQFTMKLTLQNKDNVYDEFNRWYESQDFSKKSRTLNAYNGVWGDGLLKITAGYGIHYFVYNYRIFRLSRSERESQGTQMVKETMTIETIGRSQDVFRSLLDKVTEKKKDDDKTKIYRLHGESWQLLEEQDPLPLDYVVLPKKTLKSITSHLDNFIHDKEWYIDNGIPYRTGINLFGPPGTGKSSMARALAAHYNRDLRIIQLNKTTDTILEYVLNNLDSNSIVLIEDIDSFDSVKARDLNNVSNSNLNIKSGTPLERSSVGEGGQSESVFLTLSGVLNAIDGVTSSNGRILLVTTNQIEALDAAFLRPGRIDLCQELGYLIPDTFTRMFKKFYPDYTVNDKVVFKDNVSPAYFQGLVRENRFDPENVLKEVIIDE